MYWIVGESVTKAVIVPFVFSGEATPFSATLVIEEGETINRSYLFSVNPSQAGWIQASIDNENFMDVMGMFDASCFLGTITGLKSIQVFFQFNLPSGVSGENFIILALGYDAETININSSLFCGSDDATAFPLYGDEEEDAPLWITDGKACPLYQTGSVCGKNRYDYALPGESLSKGDLVYLDVSGETPLLKKARNDSSFAEAAVLGIIDDNAMNYQFREGAAVASDGLTKIYWHGGVINSSVVNSFVYLNWETKLWFSLPSGGIARKEHVGWWYDGSFYLWGGVDGSGTFLNSLYRFDPTLLGWSLVSTGGTARALCAAVVLGSEVHFVGGVDESGVVRAVDIFDMETEEWSTGISAPLSFADIDVSLSPLHRPVWQVCNDVLFYGETTAGRTRQYWTYDSGLWEAPQRLAEIATPARGTFPNVPLNPENSLPQYCSRIQPYGLTGPAFWVCMDLTDEGSGL